MSQEVEVKIKIGVEEAEKSIGTLKQQLKAAKAEVLALSDEFGVTSQQAIKAAEKAASLGHEISAANKLVKTFNPSSTLNSTTQALGSVVEGFEVTSSSMELMGVESSLLEGAMSKVSTAMDLTSGITSIQESVGAYKNLGATLKSFSIVQKVITFGQKLWNAAMSANPIGTIIIAITALIAAGYALTNYFMSNAEAAEKNAEAVKKDTKALSDQIDVAEKNAKTIDANAKQKLAMAEAAGKSASEIRKLELKLADEKIAFEKSSREIAKNTYYKNLNTLATLKASGASDEEIKSRKELTDASLKEFEKENKNLTASVNEKTNIINRHKVEVLAAETKSNDELKKKSDEAKKDAKEKLKQELELLKTIEKKHSNDILDINAKTEKEKLELEKKRALDELDAVKLSEKQKAKAKELLLKDFQLKEEELTSSHFEKVLALNAKLEEEKNVLLAKTDEEKLKLSQEKAKKQLDVDLTTINASTTEKEVARKKLEETFALQNAELEKAKKEKANEERLNMISLEMENENISFEDKKVLIAEREALLLENQKLTESEKLRIHKDAVDSEAKIDQTSFNLKLDLWNQTASALGGLSSVFKKGTAAAKAAALAEVAIGTSTGLINGLDIAQKTAKGTGPAAAFAFPLFYATQVAAVMGAVGKAKSILGGGGGGGGAPSAGGAVATPTSAQPINVVGASQTNAIAQTIAQQGQQPIKAYVVANDVTTQQGLDRNIVSSASIG